jgi:hypothetical protein
VFGILFTVIQIAKASVQSELAGFTQPNLTDTDILAEGDKVTVDNITLRLIGSHQEGENYQVDICYTLPDNRDWLLADRGNEVFLTTDEKVIYPLEEGTINWVFAPDGSMSERCEYLLFPIVIDKDITGLTLTITQISVSPSEALDCPDIQKKLDTVINGVEIECYAGNGRSGITVVENLTDETEIDVRDMVHKIIVDARPGPWVFEGVIP